MYTSAEERDKILQDITRTSHRDLDDELRRRHAEIKVCASYSLPFHISNILLL
jgi:hypothetical protein